MRLTLLESRLQMVARDIASGALSNATAANALVRSLDEQLDTATHELMRVQQRPLRKEMLATAMSLKEVSAAAQAAVADLLQGAVSNTKVATLLARSFEGIKKKALSKKLARRAADNAERSNEWETRIAAAVTEISHGPPLAPSAESLDAYTCMLTVMSWADALQAHDCMALGLLVTRSESAIAEPTLVRIENVAETYMTANSFLDAAEFKLVSENTAPGALGTFGAAATAITVGAAREPINAVLPLFVSEEHWRVARVLMEPSLGFLTTLNVLGYAPRQYVALVVAVRFEFAVGIPLYSVPFLACFHGVRLTTYIQAVHHPVPGAQQVRANHLRGRTAVRVPSAPAVCGATHVSGSVPRRRAGGGAQYD
jgi:hypothetical protein